MPYSTQRRGTGASRPLRAYHAAPRRMHNNRSRSKFNKQYIDPSKFIKAAQIRSAELPPYEPKHAFADFDIHPLLHKNISDKGYILPSPIQDQAVPAGLGGRDIVGIADTGTGKTAAFALPIFNRLLNEPFARALVIAPTRELAQQIDDEFRTIAKGSGLYRAVLIGGSSMREQLQDLRDIPSVVIGTPGRIKDHIERGSIDLSTFNIVTLDEVDRMLDMGFINDIRFILDKVATERQSFFFSATLDKSIEQLIHTFLQDPQTISVKTGDTSENVEQNIVTHTSPQDKIEQLHDILVREDVDKAIIFDDTQRSVEKLSKELQNRGFKADSIHGGKTQGQRSRALKQFKENQIKVLVATDVAARGIDIADITHVINYSTPQTYDDYVHRIGRAGRAGRIGYALTFIER